MTEKEELPPNSNKNYNYSIALLTTSLAAYALIRRGNYRAALLLYPKSGGGGLNFYQQQENGRFKRLFAIDYHPFWDSKTKEYSWKLHYHRGNNTSQMSKHRPYDGGW